MLLLLLPSHLCFFHHPCLKDCSTWLTHYFLSEQFQVCVFRYMVLHCPILLF
uniref:Elongator complex protein 4 isoform X2 n=1 Tax=Rhizophora mucronata TaxID=61149 RepID=A0A2P2L0P6_RHIMU